jgi:hypothetical protein
VTHQELLRDPVTQRYHNGLAIILQTLDVHYMDVTRQELIEAQNTLTERYSPLRDFKAHHEAPTDPPHFYAGSQALSEMDKVKYLAAGVDHDPEAPVVTRVSNAWKEPTPIRWRPHSRTGWGDDPIIPASGESDRALWRHPG